MPSSLEAIPARRPGSQYTREQIAEAAAHYVVMGNAARVAEQVGIPVRTVVDWTNEDWWEPLSASIRRDKADELDCALTGLIHSAVAAAQDRITNGELKPMRKKDENGNEIIELARVPVSARDAMLAGAIAYDKRQIGRNLPTSITEPAGERLKLLREQLAQVSGRVIEGETVGGGDGQAAQS